MRLLITWRMRIRLGTGGGLDIVLVRLLYRPKLAPNRDVSVFDWVRGLSDTSKEVSPTYRSQILP